MQNFPGFPQIPHPKLDDKTREALKNLDMAEFKKTDAYKKHVASVIAQQKHQKKVARIEWLTNNWLNLLGVAVGLLTLAATILFGLLQLSNG